MFFVTLFSKRMASEMSSANNAFSVDLSVQDLLYCDYKALVLTLALGYGSSLNGHSFPQPAFFTVCCADLMTALAHALGKRNFQNAVSATYSVVRGHHFQTRLRYQPSHVFAVIHLRIAVGQGREVNTGHG